MDIPNFNINNRWILSQRGQKNKVDPHIPYTYLVEEERQPDGQIEEVATIFLTNKECPFRCLMCDLWKNTTDETVPIGAIPDQIEYALERLPSVKHVKLYNSGNFFDKKAIPVQDYEKITKLLSGFETVLVENHPKLMSDDVLRFRDMLNARLQVAIGLETVHPEVLPQLNKQMTLDDFTASVQFLTYNDISSRAFILLRPPFLNEDEGIEWAKRSIDFAFENGVECCAIIPTRPGNGALENLEQKDFFHSPTIESLEEVLDYCIRLKQGRVFADLWDLEQFSSCENCLNARKERLDYQNKHQIVTPRTKCQCTHHD